MKIPVLVLTGFLGSGKTTLINRILKENHGKRLAVIENEFGEVGVDNDLVVGADEEIFEMNNGCLCCTVRGDLIRILTNLGKRKDKLEMVLIETTGLADPGPVAQTFFMDPEVGDRFELKGVVILVDAFHLPLHLDSSPEVLRQIAFGDLVVVNKTDLVSQAELKKLEDRIRNINAVAPMVEAAQAGIPLEVLWNLAGFSLDRALALDGDFLLPERPFESVLSLVGGPEMALRFTTGPDQTALAYLQTGKEPALDLVHGLFEGEEEAQSTDRLVPGKFSILDLSRPGTLDLELEPGENAWLFFEHMPEEFSLELLVQGQAREFPEVRRFKPSHSHDDVASVGLISDKPLHPDKFNTWISGLLRDQGADIYRSKGILHISGSPRKHIFQGVHMLLQGGDLGYWGMEKPQSRLVFIGKNLDRRVLTQGFLACQV